MNCLKINSGKPLLSRVIAVNKSGVALLNNALLQGHQKEKFQKVAVGLQTTTALLTSKNSEILSLDQRAGTS